VVAIGGITSTFAIVDTHYGKHKSGVFSLRDVDQCIATMLEKSDEAIAAIDGGDVQPSLVVVKLALMRVVLHQLLRLSGDDCNDDDDGVESTFSSFIYCPTMGSTLGVLLDLEKLCN
jgi:hypothetical protein